MIEIRQGYNTLFQVEVFLKYESWFDWTIEEARRRFRMNLEVTIERDEKRPLSGTEAASTMLFEAFWEDSLACPINSYETMTLPSEGCLNQNMRPVNRGSFKSVVSYFKLLGLPSLFCS